LKAEYVQEGGGAIGPPPTPFLLREFAYKLPWEGAVAIYKLWKKWEYPVAGADREDAALTVYDRTYYFDETTFSNTYQLQTLTVTPPVIPEAQNGTNDAEPFDQYFDQLGRLVWERNARGFINHHEYDEATDAKTRMIQDVNSALFEECPWTTPPGGGKNLVTDYENDDLGRRLRTIKPWIVVDPSTVCAQGEQGMEVRPVNYSFYRDADHQVWKAQGYMTGPGPGSWHILGPVSVSVRKR